MSASHPDDPWHGFALAALEFEDGFASEEACHK